MSDQQHLPGTPSYDDALHSQSEAMQARPPLPGTVLATQRQARGWSVEYVASHLKLAVRQVHALEEDRYDALPGPVVTRGFIRIYAKMLGVDAAALMAALPADPTPAVGQIAPSRTLSTPFSESSLPLRGQNELPLARIAWLAAGVLVIAAAFGAVKYGNWDAIRNSALLHRLHLGAAAKQADIAAAPTADNPEPASAPTAVADNDSAPLPAEAAAAPVAAPSPAPAPAAPPAPPKLAAVPAAAAASDPVEPAAPATVAASLNNPLQLTINQDSWVEIRRADKSIVVSRTMKAGTTEAFDVTGPMSLIVGNAAGVAATLHGKPLALPSVNGNNVARLDLK